MLDLKTDASKWRIAERLDFKIFFERVMKEDPLPQARLHKPHVPSRDAHAGSIRVRSLLFGSAFKQPVFPDLPFVFRSQPEKRDFFATPPDGGPPPKVKAGVRLRAHHPIANRR